MSQEAIRRYTCLTMAGALRANQNRTRVTGGKQNRGCFQKAYSLASSQ